MRVETTGLFRWTGALASLTPDDTRALFDRGSSTNGSVATRVSEIIARVRTGGDAALRALCAELDGVSISALEIGADALETALASIDPELRRVLSRAADNIRRVHEAFMPVAQETESEAGVLIGRRPDALGRVGIYAPGGRAAYPSSVLMGVIPAHVAGVREIILCTPPLRETGQPSDVVLAAAKLSGATRVFALGGAGAVAAMAYGTESVPRVDRIVGPGNAYVAEAKIQVASAVAIDSPAGPSELLILADDTADTEVIARELLAQAEHDPLAAVVAVLGSPELALRVERAVAELMVSQPRAAICAAALRGQGAVLWAGTPDDAIAFANRYAAEHLLLLSADEDVVLRQLRNAGTVFLGQYASVAFGDYMSGANHVLPTGGLARSYSGLSTLDFVRWTTYQRISRAAAAEMANDVGLFADSEGLGGHALAARAWAQEVRA